MRVRVPGSTSNLGHGFDCMGVAVSLANEIQVRPRTDAAISTPGAADAGLASMAERCRSLCQQRWHCALPGVEIEITGNVPISRGLGSSSTIYLGLLAAFWQLAGLGELDPTALIPLGVELEGHPDNITASCLGGFTIAGQIDDALVWRRLPIPADWCGVVVIPNHEVRTQDARAVLPGQLSVASAIRGWQHSALITAAVATGDLEGFGAALAGGWHEEHRSRLNPLLPAVRQAAQAAGAAGTIISGSGSTLLAFCDRAQQTIVARALAARLPTLPVLPIDFDPSGLQVIDL